jgi:hypothetical protein
MCTTRLNDGIFTADRFSVAASARLHQSECVLRLFVYLTIRRDFYLHVEQLFFVFVFCFLFFCFFCFVFFFCLNVNSARPSSPVTGARRDNVGCRNKEY